eukprot:12810494-Ditylum_brightwellii.AAC.1
MIDDGEDFIDAILIDHHTYVNKIIDNAWFATNTWPEGIIDQNCLLQLNLSKLKFDIVHQANPITAGCSVVLIVVGYVPERN